VFKSMTGSHRPHWPHQEKVSSNLPHQSPSPPRRVHDNLAGDVCGQNNKAAHGAAREARASGMPRCGACHICYKVRPHLHLQHAGSSGELLDGVMVKV